MNRIVTASLVFLVFTSQVVTSQVAINETSPSTKAALYLEAQKIPTTNYGGFKMPVVTQVQQALIPVSTIDNSDDGLMVYVSDNSTNKHCWDIYDGEDHVWRSISCQNSVCNGDVLFSEDFNSYLEDTGITGISNTNGNYPAGVTKWTLSSYTTLGNGQTNYPGSLVNANDYALVKSGQMTFRDLNGPLLFQTQSIDISGFSDIIITLDISESGDLEYYPDEHSDDFNCGFAAKGSDYVDIEYSTDGGNTFAEVPNFLSNGNANHTLANDLSGTVNFSLSGISGTTLILKIRFQNWSDDEYYYLDNILVKCN